MKKAFFFFSITAIISFFACRKNEMTPENHIVSLDSLAGKWVLKIFDSSATAGSICDVQVISRYTAYMSDNHGFFWKTNDGAQTWTKKLVDPTFHQSIPSIHFLDSLNGYALHGFTNGLRYYSVTTDAGNTWTKKQLLFPYSQANIKDIFFLTRAVGFAVLDSTDYWYRKGYIVKTIDSGKTWQKKGFCQDPTKIFFASPQKGWVIDYWGEVYETFNGGETWKDVMNGSGNLPFHETVHGFHAFDTAHFVCGNFDGVTFHKVIPGFYLYESVTYLLNPYYGNPVTVFMLSPTTGYSINGDGAILKFDRQAANPVVFDTSFRNGTLNLNRFWTEMSFYDSSFGVIGGQYGRYLVRHN